MNDGRAIDFAAFEVQCSDSSPPIVFFLDCGLRAYKQNRARGLWSVWRNNLWSLNLLTKILAVIVFGGNSKGPCSICNSFS